MLSKNLIIIMTILGLLSACTSETIPDPQSSLPDNSSNENIAENVNQSNTTVDTNRYSETHFAIRKLIEQEKWQQAYDQLESQLYGPSSLDKAVYTSPAYSGFLELYVQLGKEIKQKGTEGAVALWNQSLAQFEERFISPCIDPGQEICEMLGQALTGESSTVWLVLELADTKEDPVTKMKVLGAAYDIQNRRGSSRLEESYLKVALSVLASVEEGSASVSQDVQNQHLINVISLATKKDWTQPDAYKISWFKLIKPWRYEAQSSQALNDLRKELISFLPVFSRFDSEVSEGMKAVVEERIKKIMETRKDLSVYPAYSDIDLKTLMSAPAEVSYLAIEMYFQNVPVTDANAFVTNVADKAAFVDEMYEASKLLVRWDIAQLGIESTEKLSSKLGEQDAITNAFFQEVLDWSKTLIPIWTEFHTVRLWSVKTFIESNIKYSRKFNEIEIQEFFTSVNRNILRTVTFPNMLAFAYNMAKTEWAATIRILWLSFELDSTIIMDYMMNGQYFTPWFNFTNLTQERVWYKEDQKTLFRSDMFDALYYFFTTRTHENYGIEANEFVGLLAETLIKQRRTKYEETLLAQKQAYFQDNAPAINMIRWCQGIKNNQPEPEDIPYYSLSNYITTVILLLRADDLSGHPPFYYGDYYELGGFERLHTTNDRYRLELEPILYTLNEYQEIVERIKEMYPSLEMGDLQESRDKIAQYEHFKMTYLGVQKAIMKKQDDCLFVAEKEAKRRVRENAFAQYDYFSKVIHPLMTKVKSGEISTEQANEVIQAFHGNQKGIGEYIDASNSDDPIYVIDQNSYLLRTRMFLTEGAKFESEFTGRIDVDPIVGSQLRIPVPSNFLEDPSNNPYMDDNTTTRYMYSMGYNADVETFAQAASARTTDESRAAIMTDRFTEWDQYELGKYAYIFRYVVEQQVIFYQIPEQRYYDVEKPNCWVTEVGDLGEDCVVEETATLDPIVKSMKNILFAYLLGEKDKRFFELAELQGWVGSNALHTVIEYDPTLQMNYMSDTYPYTAVAGIMDYPYELLSADTLGIGFQTEWDVEQAKGNDRPMDMSCAGQRDGCYWGWERSQAKEFFWARSKRPGFLFNYDYQIVEDDYERILNMVIPKYNRLIELERKSAEIINQVTSSEEAAEYITKVGDRNMVEINMYLEPSELYGLDINFTNNERLFEKFFEEETEGFFLKEHNWQEELNIQ